ncbi:hypothetical protein ACFWZW_04595 [Microbacterium enclense]|uniref:hypothetical protein n=1 Tax=Microbacterium enclense TaxID=993073 RepID=UPI0036DC0C32
MNEDLDVAEAKRVTQAVENQIVDAVPAQFVVARQQLEAGSFLSCGDGGYYWSGFITAQIGGDPDPSSILGPILATFNNLPAFAAYSRSSQGDQVIDLQNEDGSLWIVRYRDDRDELSVDSFSACFRLPDDIWPGSPY